jgi:hypothetical protein
MIDCPNGPHAHSVSEVCAMIGCDSEDWLIDRVRDGRFPARKICRQLRFTDSDIEAILDACVNQPKQGTEPRIPQLTPRSAAIHRNRQRRNVDDPYGVADYGLTPRSRRRGAGLT